MGDAPVVMALRLSGAAVDRQIGVAYADSTQQSLGLCEFADDDQFANLEAITVQLGAKECVMGSESSVEATKVKDVLQRCGVAVTTRKRSEFSATTLKQDLSRLVAPGSTQDDYADMPNAQAALGALIRYLELLSDETNHHHFNVTRFDLATHMRLDAAAVRALNLMPSPNDRIQMLRIVHC